MSHPVTPVGSSVFKYKSGTATNSVAATATQAITTSTYFQFGTLQADPDNVPDLFLGDSVAQDVQLTPGQVIELVGGDLSTVYFKTGTDSTAVNLNFLLVI